MSDFKYIPEYGISINEAGDKITGNHKRWGTIIEYKIQTAPNGYKLIQTKIEDKRKTLLVHRLVAMAFIENPLSKAEVNHRDGNKANNHVSNLEWVSKKENASHAWATGLSGESQFKSRSLEWYQLLTIATLAGKISDTDLASFYKIRRSLIQKTRKGNSYKEFTEYFPLPNSRGNSIGKFKKI